MHVRGAEPFSVPSWRGFRVRRNHPKVNGGEVALGAVKLCHSDLEGFRFGGRNLQGFLGNLGFVVCFGSFRVGGGGGTGGGFVFGLRFINMFSDFPAKLAPGWAPEGCASRLTFLTLNHCKP